jgi:hypothetical protein
MDQSQGLQTFFYLSAVTVLIQSDFLFFLYSDTPFQIHNKIKVVFTWDSMSEIYEVMTWILLNITSAGEHIWK